MTNKKELKKKFRIETLKNKEEEKEKRLKLLYSEIVEKCIKLNHYEFEYSCEAYDLLGYEAYYIEINGKRENFITKGLSTEDFDNLLKLGLIELVKEYEIDELTNDEDFRIRYKVRINQINS